MNKEYKDKVLEYIAQRDYFIRNQNKVLACFYQVWAIHIIENDFHGLRKKKKLKDQFYILEQIFCDLLGFYDAAYFRGLYHEIIAIYLEDDSSVCQKNYILAENYYRMSGKKEYTIETIGIHIIYLQEYYYENKERGNRYTYDFLRMIENRYGRNSIAYAKTWLHVLGEVISIQDINEFCEIFSANCHFFELYLAQYVYYFDCSFLFLLRLLDEGDKKYEDSFNHYVELIENNKDSDFYYYYKAKSDYLRAKKCEMEHENAKAADILQKAIYFYVQSEKNSIVNLFYGWIYLKAALNYKYIGQYDEMIKMAELGLELCVNQRAIDTDVYFSLYNLKGIKYLAERRYKDAVKIFSTALMDIEKKLGKENENYIECMYNLGVVALQEGRIADAKRYFDSLYEIENPQLAPLCKNLLNFNKYIVGLFESVEDGWGDLGLLYKVTIGSMIESRDKYGLIRIQLIYMFNKVKENIVLDKKDRQLLDYINSEGGLDEEQNILLSFIVILDKWNNEKVSEVMPEFDKLVNNIGENLYLYSYKDILISYIQILCINERYPEAISFIEKAYKESYEQIMKYGIGDVQNQLFYIRVIISIYIKIWEKGICDFDNDDLIKLYTKVIECKSLEKEILKIIGKYDCSDEDVSFNMYKSQDIHRKIAALRLRKQLMEEECLAEEELLEIESEINRYSLEKEKVESELWKYIDLGKLISRFDFREINMPEDAVCVEFFAYYDWKLEKHIYFYGEEDELKYNYIVFIVSGQNGKPVIDSFSIIESGKIYMDDFFDLFDFSPEEIDVEKYNLIINNLTENLLNPIMHYIEPYSMVYWGLDFLMQMIPIDALSYNGNLMLHMKNNIYIDSIRDIHSDIMLDFKNMSALVLGDPQYNINNNYEQQIPQLNFSMDECMGIAKILGTIPFLGTEAKQSVFREKSQADVLHISTHGDLTLENYDKVIYESSLLTNSYLILAGFEDWVNNRMIKGYGNGLITADDFIFTDLSNTKLVVLSACVSGIGMMKGLQSLHGLRWAIGVSGAQSSITALWEVDDFATAILMVFLYRNLTKLPVGHALQVAKQQLRNLKVSDILIDDVLVSMVRKMSIDLKDDYDYRPFENWRYWAAFVCYIG